MVEESPLSYNGWSILGIALEALFARVNGVPVHVFWKRNLVIRVHNGMQLLEHVELLEGSLAVNHLIQDATKRPDIRGLWRSNEHS